MPSDRRSTATRAGSGAPRDQTITATHTAPGADHTSHDDAPSFRDLGVPKKLNDALHREGLTSPFPIQVQSVPAALEGRDLCGRAPTGSGKTLAFAIPLVENTESAQPHRPHSLVLTPTRELAGQIRDVVLPLAKTRRLWVQTFYGGTSVKRDVAALRKGVDIAVCTPGRLEDLIEQGEIHLDDVRLVVLDEADRMADMGFLPVVKRLLDQTHRDRQTLLFSATLDGDVDVLVKRYQHDPVVVEVDESEEEQGDVTHHFWDVRRDDRKQLLSDALRRSGSTIVFARTKRGADRLAKQLSKGGLSTAAIHGNRSQNQRERALAQFQSGQVTALIATDVAARGIHVDDVDTVIHYDLPNVDKDYVHRSGRTGRAGRDGVVVSFVYEDQHKDLRSLVRDIDVDGRLVDVDLDHLDGTAPTRRTGGGDARPRPAQRQRSTSRERGADTDGRDRRGDDRQADGRGGGRRTGGGRSNGGRSSGGGRSGRQSDGGSSQPRGGARSRSRRRR